MRGPPLRDANLAVQDPNEAEYDGMPQSAIATGMVDLILPVAEIPGNILRFEPDPAACPSARRRRGRAAG